MASTLEVEAKNVEQAVALACEKLDIAKDELKYNVISHGSTGIFGLGRTKKAKIRVILPKGAPPSEPGDPESMDLSDAGERQNHVQNLIQETFQTPQASDAGGEDPTALGLDVLQRIVDSITSDAKITVDASQPQCVRYNINGGHSAVLIGKHGQTLEAIQSLVEKIVNKHNEGRIRVQVDVEGYLENRKQQLIRQAERLAGKCKKIRKPVTVGFMNAHDRRIVHLALKDDRQVKTRSTGDGAFKKLMIFPQREPSQRRNSR
jgi:spoIIIJ-associated protein